MLFTITSVDPDYHHGDRYAVYAAADADDLTGTYTTHPTMTAAWAAARKRMTEGDEIRVVR